MIVCHKSAMCPYIRYKYHMCHHIYHMSAMYVHIYHHICVTIHAIYAYVCLMSTICPYIYHTCHQIPYIPYVCHISIYIICHIYAHIIPSLYHMCHHIYHMSICTMMCVTIYHISIYTSAAAIPTLMAAISIIIIVDYEPPMYSIGIFYLNKNHDNHIRPYACHPLYLHITIFILYNIYLAALDAAAMPINMMMMLMIATYPYDNRHVRVL